MCKLKFLFLLVFFSGLFFSMNSQTSKEGLIGYWKFDSIENGKVKDFSGNGLDGNVINFSLSEGKFGKAMNGNGNGYLEIPWNTIIDNLQNGLTVCAWVNRDSSSSWNCIITREIGSGWSEYFDIGFFKNKALFSIDPGGKDHFTQVDDPEILPLNKWIYLVGVYNNKVLQFYINGKLVGERNLNIPINTNDKNPIIIGSNSNDNGKTWHDYFFGKIDEVRLYNKPLSKLEVEELYNFYQ